MHNLETVGGSLLKRAKLQGHLRQERNLEEQEKIKLQIREIDLDINDRIAADGGHYLPHAYGLIPPSRT